MNSIRFLFDEHVPESISIALASWEPAMIVRHVGIDNDVPPKGTGDVALLEFARREPYVIVTFDKRTFPAHTYEEMDSGRPINGLVVDPNGNRRSVRTICDDLILIWTASDPSEWVDRVDYLPL